jgi:hypothetical protein
VDGIGIAFRTGEVRGCRTRGDEQLVLLLRHFADREGDSRIRDVDDHVDLVDIEPQVGDVRSDIGLVLMIDGNDLDLHAFGGSAEILDRELGCGDRAWAAIVGIEARHIGQDANLDDAVSILRLGRTAGQERRHRDILRAVFMPLTPNFGGSV